MADTTQNDDSPGDLRNQRDQLANDKKDLAAKLAAYEQDEQLREAGFGHLSKRQRRTILRDLAEDGLDLSKESVTDIATEHGYPLVPTTPTPTPTGDGERQDPDQQQGNGQNGENSDIEDSLTAMDLMRRAQQIASGNAPASDFEDLIRKTTNKEQLTELLRTQGARHGIVHEWDVP